MQPTFIFSALVLLLLMLGEKYILLKWCGLSELGFLLCRKLGLSVNMHLMKFHFCEYGI